MVRPPVERQTPRITANELALFMVSSDTARFGIIRRSKYPQTPPIIRYRDVKEVVCSFLADPMRHVNRLVSAESMFSQRAADNSVSPLKRDDAMASIDVLHSLQGMSNQLNSLLFEAAPSTQDKLLLAGVEVSVRADLVTKLVIRGQDFSGVAVLRLTQDAADTEAARSKRRDMGVYVATLARMHADQNFQFILPVSNRACVSIDIQHGEMFQAPAANSRRIADLENACRFIAGMWESTTPLNSN